MEIIPDINQKKRYSGGIKIYPYLRDHHLEGKTILPAVESMMILARAVKLNYPRSNVHHIQQAAFLRFLYIPQDVTCQPVFVDMDPSEDGVITASLRTSLKSKTGNITREIEHARACFITTRAEETSVFPFHVVNPRKGTYIAIPSTTAYRELIPFGVAYQNIVGDLSLTTEDALAYISGGRYEADESLLGSPFPLDAVMHLASVWGQRFADVVSFPVGIEKRIIYRKARKGREYFGRVVPVHVTPEYLVFDAWIYDEGILCERIRGLKMMDVTGGRLRPPEWIREGQSLAIDR